MTQQVSEAAILPIKPGTDLESGDVKTALHAAFQALTSQTGCQNLFYGRQVEHPDFLQLSIDWDAVDSFKAFIGSSGYGAFKENLGLVMGGPPRLAFAARPEVAPFSNVASAPVSEMVELYFPADYPEADFDKNFASFKQVVEETAAGVKGVVGGWSVEEMPPREGEDSKDKLFLAAIGWESIDAHMAFRETEGFKKAIPLLKEGVKNIKMHHVKFTKF